MKQKTAAEKVLQWQTVLAYTFLLGIFILCLYQLPRISEFLREYGDAMKAAFPVR